MDKNIRSLSFVEQERPMMISRILGNDKAKRMLRIRLSTYDMRPGFWFHGAFGVGKTTFGLALARAICCTRRPSDSIDCCGACDGCNTQRQTDRQSKLIVGQGIMVRNCARYTIADLEADVEEAGYIHDRPIVILLEEMQTAKDALQSRLITCLDDNDLDIVFIICTSDRTQIDAPIRERLTPVAVQVPSPEEMAGYLMEVAARRGWPVGTEAVMKICKQEGNNPRRCLNALREIGELL